MERVMWKKNSSLEYRPVPIHFWLTDVSNNGGFSKNRYHICLKQSSYEIMSSTTKHLYLKCNNAIMWN
jgi:hypothetical protein